MSTTTTTPGNKNSSSHYRQTTYSSTASYTPTTATYRVNIFTQRSSRHTADTKHHEQHHTLTTSRHHHQCSYEYYYCLPCSRRFPAVCCELRVCVRFAIILQLLLFLDYVRTYFYDCYVCTEYALSLLYCQLRGVCVVFCYE